MGRRDSGIADFDISDFKGDRDAASVRFKLKFQFINTFRGTTERSLERNHRVEAVGVRLMEPTILSGQTNLCEAGGGFVSCTLTWNATG